MRGTRILTRGALALSSFAMLFVLGGCPKHENFPTQIELVEAPAPKTFHVAAKGIDATGAYQYDLTWTMADVTNVDHYRLYLIGAGPAPELAHETTPEETDALFLPIKVPFNAQGLQFGISTVSTGFVESTITTAFVPDSLSTN